MTITQTSTHSDDPLRHYLQECPLDQEISTDPVRRDSRSLRSSMAVAEQTRQDQIEDCSHSPIYPAVGFPSVALAHGFRCGFSPDLPDLLTDDPQCTVHCP